MARRTTLDTAITADIQPKVTAADHRTANGRMMDYADDLTYDIDLRDYNVDPTGVTDSTPGIQQAMNDAYARGGGRIKIKDGVYLLSGALQTSINGTNPNSQLYVPLTRFGIDNGAHIELCGESKPNMLVNQIGAGAINNGTGGVIFNSTIVGTGTMPCVIGTPTYAGPFGNWNHTNFSMTNIIVRTKTNTGDTHFVGTMSGLNFESLSNFRATFVSVEITSALSSMAEPTNPTVGIVMPRTLNFAFLHLDVVRILGFNVGLIPGEHLNCSQLYLVWLKTAIYMKNPQQHGMHIGCLCLETTATAIRVGADNRLHISAWHIEHIHEGAPAWCLWVADATFDSGVTDSAVSVDHCNVGWANNVGLVERVFGTNNPNFVNITFFNELDVQKSLVPLLNGDTWKCIIHKRAAIALIGNTAIPLLSPRNGEELTLFYSQDATGGRTLTIGGVSVPVTATASAKGVLKGFFDGTAWIWQ